MWWYKEKIEPRMQGYSGIVVYADDFVVTFQYRSEAEEFYRHLKQRMRNFGLSIEEEKSRLIKFGRFAQRDAKQEGRKAETFAFLGFTHYCSVSRNGKFRAKRKTAKKKFSKKVREVHQKIKSMRNQKVKETISKLNEILVGYYHYYGITDNSRALVSFQRCVRKSLYYWLNRRSQKKSSTWEGFEAMLKV